MYDTGASEYTDLAAFIVSTGCIQIHDTRTDRPCMLDIDRTVQSAGFWPDQSPCVPPEWHSGEKAYPVCITYSLGLVLVLCRALAPTEQITLYYHEHVFVIASHAGSRWLSGPAYNLLTMYTGNIPIEPSPAPQIAHRMLSIDTFIVGQIVRRLATTTGRDPCDPYGRRGMILAWLYALPPVASSLLRDYGESRRVYSGLRLVLPVAMAQATLQDIQGRVRVIRTELRALYDRGCP